MDLERPVPVFMPALIVLLGHQEQQKGAPLTEAEVLEVRDRAVCMMMAPAQAQALEARRGYPDLSPERCWEEWQAYRAGKPG